MDNDTPSNGSGESHDSFISRGNADETQSVQPGMEDTTHSPAEGSKPPVPAATDPIATVPSGASDTSEGASVGTDLWDDGPAVELAEPNSASADSDGGSPDEIPTAAFEYDDPLAPSFEDGADTGTFEAVPPPPPPVAVSPTTAEPDYVQKHSGALYLIGALVAAVLGSLLTVGVLAATGAFDDTPVPVSSPPVTVVEAVQEPTQIINDLGAALNETAVAAKVIPSIVTVNVFQTSTDNDGTEIPVGSGSGSGVVQSTEGYIITNHHVIEGGDEFSVTFEDGRAYEATLIGSDELTDLAILQIDADGLVPIEYGTSESLNVGDPAVAVGNPLGQTGGASITSGIISAFNRRVDFADTSSLFGMIQTDAAINSGSSGGALVDAEGKLIGITSAIGVSTAGPEGIGYAIPIELVDRITAEIIETGDVVHPFMGVEMRTYFDEAADGAIVPAGAIIGSVEGEDTAAGAAGMEVDDIVVAIEGDPITSQSDLILKVRLYRVGDTVTFTVVRGGEEVDLQLTLGQRPPEFQG